jgi:hypothetical protein
VAKDLAYLAKGIFEMAQLILRQPYMLTSVTLQTINKLDSLLLSVTFRLV